MRFAIVISKTIGYSYPWLRVGIAKIYLFSILVNVDTLNGKLEEVKATRLLLRALWK